MGRDAKSQGQPLPLDRAVRHYARAKKSTVASSTALHYAQFAERLAEWLGDREVSRLTEEDIGEFIRAEHAADRAQDPTINAGRSAPLGSACCAGHDSCPHRIPATHRAWRHRPPRHQFP